MYKQLTSEQRYVISALLKRKVSKKEIAKEIGVSMSTIYREIKRNATAGAVIRRPCPRDGMERERIVTNSSVKPDVRREARLLTGEQWSPKQISGYLALKASAYPTRRSIR